LAIRSVNAIMRVVRLYHAAGLVIRPQSTPGAVFNGAAPRAGRGGVAARQQKKPEGDFAARLRGGLP